MKKILVAVNSAANNIEKNVLRAFYAGLESYFFERHSVDGTDELLSTADIELVLCYDKNMPECDVGIQFGSTKDRAGDHHVIKQELAKKARCVVIIETPLLGRVIADRYSQYRVGVNGFLNGQGRFFDPKRLLPKRFAELEEKYEIPGFPGWKKRGKGVILVTVQLPGDASLRGTRMSEWLTDTVDEIRSVTDRAIVIRTHPAMSDKGGQEFFGEISALLFKNYENITWSDGKSRTLKQDLDRSDVCVSFSSGASIDAILAGVPVIATDQGNFAWPVSSHDISEVLDPRQAPRGEIEEWLEGLANSQWSTREMRSGIVWQRIEPMIQEALKR
jgi:hypothetical protein